MELFSEAAALPTAYLASRYQLCSNSRLLVIPGPARTLRAYHLDDLTREPSHLHCACVHRHSVGGAAISSTSDLLVTVSSDMLALWTNPSDLPDDVIAVYPKPGSSLYVSLSDSDDYACLCIDNDVIIVNIMDRKLEATLQGHSAPVTAAQFFSDDPLVLVSISEDRTFKVWDVENGCLLHQSAVLSGSPCLSMAMHHGNDLLAVGFSDGLVKMFDMRSDKSYSCLHDIDVVKETVNAVVHSEASHQKTDSEAKTIRSHPGWRVEYSDDSGAAQQHVTMATSAQDDVMSSLSTGGYAILGLAFVDIAAESRSAAAATAPSVSRQEEISRQRLCDILQANGRLVISTAACLICASTSAWQIERYFDLRLPLLQKSPDLGSSLVDMPTAGAFDFSLDPFSRKVWCIASGALVASVTVLQLTFPAMNAGQGMTGCEVASGADAIVSCSTACDGDVHGDAPCDISVLSSTPLSRTSVLSATLQPCVRTSSEADGSAKRSQAAGPGGKAGAVRSAKSAVKDQPLTFKSKVKSSGYTAAPRSKMFAPQTRPSPSTSKKQSAAISSKGSCLVSGKTSYPTSAPAPIHLKTRLPISQQQSAINKILFSASGASLACAMSSKTVDIIRTPLNSASKISTAAGHDGAVIDVSWAAQGSNILTAGTDRTVRMWTAANMTEPLIVFDRQQQNAPSASAMKKAVSDKQSSGVCADANTTFAKDITHARFYFMDKFVTIACGNSFGLYLYHISTEKADDVKRYQRVNRYKLAKQFQHSTAQSITAMSCVNSFNSYVVLVGGSDKSVEVFDMNAGRPVRLMKDVHCRPPYIIHQNEGSQYMAHTSEAYDLFLTSAVADDLKLWDLRTDRCVRRYHGHMQRAHQLGVAFSPCSRFIAAASEDRSVYIYDIRQTAHLHRLSGHSDVVSDVAFNPKHPQLCSSTLDGKLTIFNDKPS